MKDRFVYGVLAASFILIGWLAGGRQAIEAQPHPGSSDYTAYTANWVMHSQHVTSDDFGNSGSVYLYNAVNGHTYRVFHNCGPNGYSGCLVQLEAYTQMVGGDASSFVPTTLE